MSVIRINGKDRLKLVELADKILKAWREYSDESLGIFAYTNDTPHNTVTPIARRRGENFELDLVLRNNRTSEEHPLGIFHPHADVHNIKKENIGLIEVMGLAVLPGRLKEELDIPVFHDDQHGTAIVVAAGLINALKVVNKKVEDIKVVVNGAGAAGSSIIKLIKKLGAKEVIAVDRVGILRRSDKDKYDFSKKELAEITNSQDISGGLAEAIVGADVFVGVSAPNLLSKDMVRSMNRDAIVFAMANPTPEIMPEDALEAGAAIVGTGRSDYPNQINNVLVFPGLFKGALRAKSKKITEEMKIAAAEGLASLIKPEELRKDYIIPDAFDKRVAEAVASAVEKLAKEQGICRG